MGTIEGGGVCALAAAQTSNSPQHTSTATRTDNEGRENTACKDRGMRAPEAREAAIVIRARRARQGRAQHSVQGPGHARTRGWRSRDCDPRAPRATRSGATMCDVGL
ncbi:hypothetical protein F6Y24_21105 [Xanthomonas arboricola pv. pruni]|nr:hypothetical protein F6Y24_21105 [Xanthomonas arboricola pv. pruni]RST73227.1 hypothetical protein EJK96_02545 [Xanthomonas arboricola pv. pruni]RST75951.1 hypothetical protein EJL05_18270 [Xanthomonas arboricola pv. pruni]